MAIVIKAEFFGLRVEQNIYCILCNFYARVV